MVAMGLALNGCIRCGPIWDGCLQSPKSLQVGHFWDAGGHGWRRDRCGDMLTGNPRERSMKVFRIAAVMALLAAPAYAQMATPNINLIPELQSKSPEEKEQEAQQQKAYKESLKKIPDAKASSDPWGNVRSGDTPKAPAPVKPRTKTGSTAN
jgi:hypothetical protein